MTDGLRVGACWRYPVKSLQGQTVDRLDVGVDGVAGDRTFALHDLATDRLASAKRFGRLLELAGHDDGRVTLPDGTTVEPGDDGDAVLSTWLDRDVVRRRAQPDTEVAYQMTFDPPDDDAELYDIPAPVGTFLDLAPIHLLSSATLAAATERRRDLDWDVRRFRPNLVIDGADEPFVEQRWVGHRLRVGDVELHVDQPTVRCAMPLRAQPGLDRQPALYQAMVDLNTEAPNHLGAYATVTRPGPVTVGQPVTVLD